MQLRTGRGTFLAFALNLEDCVHEAAARLGPGRTPFCKILQGELVEPLPSLSRPRKMRNAAED